MPMPLCVATITRVGVALCVMTPMLMGCDRPANPGPAPASITGSATTSPDLQDTVGGPGIVADTTFSTGQAHSPSVVAQADADVLMNDEPTSAGLPPDAATTLAQDLLNDKDRRFLQNASSRGAYDLALARLGSEKAKDPEVKLFAERLMAHHQQANNALFGLAGRHGAEARFSLAAADREMIDRLAKSSGQEFDARLLALLGMKTRQANIAFYEKVASEAESPVVRAFAQAEIPPLRQHLDSADALQRSQAEAQTANPMP